MASIEQFRSGMRLITCENLNSNSVSIGVWIGVGSRYEPFEKQGISHFTEHLSFRGTKKRKNSYEIAAEIESVGGYLNAETGSEHTGYVTKVPHNYASLGFDVLFDMIFNSDFKEKDIVSEKDVVKEEISTYKDMPSEHVYDVLKKLIWDKQALGRETLGTEESISSLTLDDLVDFSKNYYTPSNIVVSVVGNISHSDCINNIKKYTKNAKYTAGAKDASRDNGGNMVREEQDDFSCGTSRKFEAARYDHKDVSVHLEKKDCSEAHLCFGVRTVPITDERSYTLKIIDVILGKGMSSRLFQQLRDKRGLAYNLESEAMQVADDGAYIIYVGSKLNKFKESVDVVISELKKIKQGDISGDDIERAKRYYRGMFQLRVEDTLTLAELAGKSLLLKDEKLDVDKIFEKIDAVSVDDVIDFSNRYFINENLNLAVISPYDDVEKIIGEISL